MKIKGTNCYNQFKLLRFEVIHKTGYFPPKSQQNTYHNLKKWTKINENSSGPFRLVFGRTLFMYIFKLSKQEYVNGLFLITVALFFWKAKQLSFKKY